MVQERELAVSTGVELSGPGEGAGCEYRGWSLVVQERELAVSTGVELSGPGEGAGCEYRGGA